jgi:uncharacterized protein (TIGR02246 family)
MAFQGPLEDRIAIRELLESYGDAVFRHDPVAWGDCWAQDATWTLPGIGATRGRAAIVETWRAAMHRFEQVSFHTTLGALAIAGDRAEGRAYTSEVLKPKAGGILRMEGAYEDLIIRQEGRWLFAARSWRVLVDGSQT